MSDDDDPFEMSVAMTRGNSTNDRDKIKATISAETLEELDEKMEEMRDRLEKMAADIRTIQPDDEDERLDENQATLRGEAA